MTYATPGQIVTNDFEIIEIPIYPAEEPTMGQLLVADPLGFKIATSGSTGMCVIYEGYEEGPDKYRGLAKGSAWVTGTGSAWVGGSIVPMATGTVGCVVAKTANTYGTVIGTGSATLWKVLFEGA